VTGLLVDALLQPDDVGLRNAAVESFARAEPRDTARVASVLAEGLTRAAPTARKFLASALVGGANAAVPVLAALARVEDVMTASAAVEALAALASRGVESPTAEEVLVGVLGRPEPVLRLAAIDGLLAFGAVVSSSALRDVLSDPITTSSAVRLLGRARDDESLELLLGMLSRPRVTLDAALALAAWSDPGLPVAVRLDDDARDRLGLSLRALVGDALTSLAGGLASLPSDQARSLSRMLLDAAQLHLLPAIVELGARTELDPASRSSLVALGTRAIEPLLAIVRTHAVSDVRTAAWALEAASELAALEATPAAATIEELKALARSLADQDETARRAGDSVLARWEPARAGRTSVSPPTVDELRTVLATDDASRRAAAIDALVSVETPDRVEIVSLALTDEDERVQLAALRALGRARGIDAAVSAAGASRVALGSELASVRAEALATLSSLGAWDTDERAAELLALVADPSPRVVIAALRAIAIGDLPRAAGARGSAVDATFDEALRHADPEVVREAILELGHGASHSAFERARRALDHAHWSVRLRAAEVFGRASTRSGALSALSARRPLETDELVLRAIDAGLTGPSGHATGGEGA